MTLRNRRSYRVIRWKAEFSETAEIENTQIKALSEAFTEAFTEVSNDDKDEKMTDAFYENLLISTDEVFFDSHFAEHVKSNDDHKIDDHAIHDSAIEFDLDDTSSIFWSSDSNDLINNLSLILT